MQAGHGLQGQEDHIRFLANSGLVLIPGLRQVTDGRVKIRNQGKGWFLADPGSWQPVFWELRTRIK